MAVLSPTNDYWTNTNNGVDNNILSQTQNGDYVTNWWVGDYAPLDAGSGPSPSPAPFGHFGFYGQGTDLEDKYIYGNATIGDSTSSVQYFDFIWTCANGGIYWTNNNDGYNRIAGINYGLNANQPNNPPSYYPLNTNTQYGTTYNGIEVGMPYAWTGTTGMSTNGYWFSSGNYCYIGFEGPQ